MTYGPDDMGILQDGTDLDLTAPPVPDPEPPADPPAPEIPPAPPAPDPWAAVTALAEQQRQVLDLQRQQLERQNQPPAPAAWVDPYDRPEIQEQLDDLRFRVSIGEEGAGRKLQTLERQIGDERLDHRMNQREQALRAEMQAGQQVEQVTGTLRQEARAYGDLVTDEALNEVQNEVFANQPAHIRANALQDPALRQLIVQAAAGRRVLSGQQRPPNAPKPPTPPPAVRSDNRGPAPSRATPQNWSDTTYMENAIQDAWRGGK